MTHSTKRHSPDIDQQAASPPESGIDETRRDVLKAAAVGAGLVMAGAMVGGKVKAAEPAAPPWNIFVLMTDDGPINSYGATESAFTVISSEYLGGWISYPNGSVNDPLCAPGRAATLSGKVGQHHNVTDNNTGNNFNFMETWIAELVSAGYMCGGYGKLMNGYGVDFIPPALPQFADFRMVYSEPGYFNYTLLENGQTVDYHERDPLDPADGTDYSTDVSRQHILNFINAQMASPLPWAVFWAPNSPHKDAGDFPIPPKRYRGTPVTLVDPENFNCDPATQIHMRWLRKYLLPDKWPMPTPQIEAIHEGHKKGLRALRAVDEALRAIMDRLEANNQLSNTVIFVLTDNGHNYGAHALEDKGTSFEESLNLLLRVRYPDAAVGVRTQAVSNIDIGPTILDMAGVPLPTWMDGVSFRSTFTNPGASFREAALFSHWKDGKSTPAMDGLRYPDHKITVGRVGGSAEGQAWRHDLSGNTLEMTSMKVTEEEKAHLQSLLDDL